MPGSYRVSVAFKPKAGRADTGIYANSRRPTLGDDGC